MADRFIVAVDTDFNARRTVYDIVDLEKNMYFEYSYLLNDAHTKARTLNEGRDDPEWYRSVWKKMPYG